MKIENMMKRKKYNKEKHSTVILTNGFRNIIIRNMIELELQQYLLREYPREDAR